LLFFAITVSAIYSLGNPNACNAISASQDLPFDRYSDFTPSRALGAAHKGGGDLFAPNPLCRFHNFVGLILDHIASQYKQAASGSDIPHNLLVFINNIVRIE